MKGKKIATRNKLSIYYSESDGYSVYAPDGRCLSKGYYHFEPAEKFCLNNTSYLENTSKKTKGV